MQNNVIDISQKNLNIAEITSIVNFENNYDRQQRKLLLKMFALNLVFLFWAGLTLYLPFHAGRSFTNGCF